MFLSFFNQIDLYEKQILMIFFSQKKSAMQFKAHGLYSLNNKQEAQSHCDVFFQWSTKEVDLTYKKSPSRTNPILKKVFSTQILSEKFKWVALKNYVFENRQNRNIN